MAKVTRAGEVSSVTPLDQAELAEGERKVYRLRAPSVFDRARLRRAVRRLGARPVGAEELKQRLILGIEEVFALGGDPAEAQTWIQKVERQQELAEHIGARLVFRAFDAEPDSEELELAELSAELANVEAIVERHYPPYRDLIADLEFLQDVGKLAAIQLFVVGAQNLELGEIGPDGLTEAQLAMIPPEHVEELGRAATGLTGPTRQEAKNL